MNTTSEHYEDEETPAAWLGERATTAADDAEVSIHDGLVLHLVIGLSAAAVACVLLGQQIIALFH